MACSHHTQHNVGALNHGDLGGTLLLPSESHLRDQFLIRVKWRAAQNPSLSFLVRPRRLQLFFFNISNFFNSSICLIFPTFFDIHPTFSALPTFPRVRPNHLHIRTPLDGQTVDSGVKFQNSAAFSHYRKLNCFPRTAHTQSD